MEQRGIWRGYILWNILKNAWVFVHHNWNWLNWKDREFYLHWFRFDVLLWPLLPPIPQRTPTHPLPTPPHTPTHPHPHPHTPTPPAPAPGPHPTHPAPAPAPAPAPSSSAFINRWHFTLISQLIINSDDQMLLISQSLEMLNIHYIILNFTQQPKNSLNQISLIIQTSKSYIIGCLWVQFQSFRNYKFGQLNNSKDGPILQAAPGTDYLMESLCRHLGELNIL